MPTKDNDRRSYLFHFGFCNACERYAVGVPAGAILGYPTKDAVVTAEWEAHTVTAGVHSALSAIVDGEIESVLQTARSFGLSDKACQDLQELVLCV